MRRRWILLGIATLGLASYLLTGLKEIKPGERGLVRRFGKVLDIHPGPGLWFGFPQGIDRVDAVAIDRVRNVTIGYQAQENAVENQTPDGQFLTGDHNLVNLQLLVTYTVDEYALADYVQNADQAELLISRTTEEVAAEWTAKRPVDTVLIRAKTELPQVILDKASASLEDYHLGVRLQNASILLAQPPEEVRDAFDQVTRSQTGIQTQINSAEREAMGRRREAEALAVRLRSQALAESQAVRAQARADARVFLARLSQYEKLGRDNPQFLATIWHEEMGKLFDKLNTSGRIDLLDHHLAGDELTITQMPLSSPRKKP